MKKSILFASVIAMIAMFAVSCKKETPKVRFSYEAKGLDVTFKNQTKSESPCTYVWDFGDGQTSTEENPTHSYAKAGSFPVKLTATNAGGTDSKTLTVDVIEPAFELNIDGNFDDWATVPASKIAQASANADTKYEYLYGMKFCADANYLYFFLEFEAGTYKYIPEGETEEVDGFRVDPIDIYMNVDGDSTTGSNSYLWENSAADILIEGFWSDKFESAGVYVFPADADQAAWAWVNANIPGSTESCEAQILANGHRAIEGKITLAALPIKATAMKVGVFTSNTEWKESGCLPQTTINDDGTTTASPLLEVPFN